MKRQQIIHRSTTKVFFTGFITGILGLNIFYYLLFLLVTHDVSHPFDQFLLYQPWMSLLSLGFGIQMGLFWLMRQGVHYSLDQKHDARMAAGTGTAVSGLSMVACCVHHLVEVIPLLGVSAAAIFLTEYQQELLIFGVFANVLGIFSIAWMITGKPKLSLVTNYFVGKVTNL